MEKIGVFDSWQAKEKDGNSEYVQRQNDSTFRCHSNYNFAKTF
jgi:hypothetical protein